MDTKWKNTDKKILIFTCIVLSLSLVLLRIILLEYRHYRYSFWLTFCFAVSVIYLLVFCAVWLVKNAEKKYEDQKPAYFFRLKKLQQLSVLTGAAYVPAVLFFLLAYCPDQHRFITWNIDYSILGNLLSYSSTEWLVPLLLFGPVVSFSLLLYLESSKRIATLVSDLLEQDRTQKQHMEQLAKEAKSAIEEQVKSERMKIDLITNVSHDLKTPLTSIIGYLALMKKEEVSREVQEYLTVVSEKADILKKMVETVFDLARASSGSTVLDLQELDLNRLVKQVLADWNERIQDTKKTFKVDLTEAPATLLSDSTYLYRIVQNLIENAVKYSLDNTRIFVRTRQQDNRISLETVNVSGYPLDVEPERLKERFVRGDAARSSEGNGLGLAIVDTYTAALGGTFTIFVEGDTFKACVSFPVKKEAAKG